MCSVWIGVDTEVTVAQVIWRSKSNDWTHCTSSKDTAN